MDDEVWESRAPDAPGYFRRRIRFIHLTLRDIRIMRWKGKLVWNFADEKRGFDYFRPTWFDKCLDYQRYNGVDHPP